VIMANNWYDAGRKYQLDGHLNPAVDTIKVCLIKSTYIPNLATHDFLDDLGTNRIGTDQTLGTITTTAGTFKAANAVFSAVPGGSQENFLALYKLVGDGSATDVTSPLLMLFDTVGGLPIVGGGNITIFWDASGIFRV
jgi:hypothetical protein